MRFQSDALRDSCMYVCMYVSADSTSKVGSWARRMRTAADAAAAGAAGLAAAARRRRWSLEVRRRRRPPCITTIVLITTLTTCPSSSSSSLRRRRRSRSDVSLSCTDRTASTTSPRDPVPDIRRSRPANTYCKSVSIGTGSPKCDPGPGDPGQVLTRWPGDPPGPGRSLIKNMLIVVNIAVSSNTNLQLP